MADTQEQLAEGRKTDGYLIVTQDNATKALTILGVNDVAAKRLDYPADELKGRRLEVVLSSKIAHALADDLEFEEGAPDMADILSRHRELRLRTRSGEEFAVPATVNRVMAEDHNPRFQLIIPDEREARARSQLREMLQQNMEGHTQLDSDTGLPNRATAQAYLRVAGNYLNEAQASAVFAVLRLDRYEKSVARYGQSGVIAQLKHVASCCRSTFRTEDVICMLDGPYLGLLLVDISRETARMVLNRLRWNIRSHHMELGGKSDFSVTVSIAFDMLTADNSAALLAHVESMVSAVGADERNILTEQNGNQAA